jgi:hypothetical protein
MGIDIEARWNDALALSEAGRFREANLILRDILTEAADPTLRLVCARLVAREILIDVKEQGSLPDPGTAQYDDLCRFLSIAVESYDLADGPARDDAHEDVARFKALLDHIKVGQQASNKPRSRDEATVLMAGRLLQLAVQNKDRFHFFRLQLSFRDSFLITLKLREISTTQTAG